MRRYLDVFHDRVRADRSLVPKLIDEAGLPKGVLSVLPSNQPREVTTALIEDGRLRKMSEASAAALGFDSAQFRDALSCSLEMLGTETLREVAAPDGLDVHAWAFPALDRLPGADLSWATTMDALRPPRRPDQKLWEWRKESPVRPVVFRDPRQLDDRTVHLHLEHRVVKRLLGRFVAQGFVHHRLSRACVLVTPHAEPRVVLLGRLSLFGEGASRLHDEIVVVTARWRPRAPGSHLRPYATAGAGESATLAQLDQAVGDQDGRHIAAAALQQLQDHTALDVADLLPFLQNRAEAAAVEAEELLTHRGAAEAASMLVLLQRQRERIQTEQAKHMTAQLPLGFSDDESKQLRADMKAWERRLTAIEQELKTEPNRIQKSFEVRLPRVEPLGVVYLWPEAG